MNSISYKRRSYCIFTPLNFNTEFFLSLNLVSLLFLLSSIVIVTVIVIIMIIIIIMMMMMMMIMIIKLQHICTEQYANTITSKYKINTTNMNQLL